MNSAGVLRSLLVIKYSIRSGQRKECQKFCITKMLVLKLGIVLINCAVICHHAAQGPPCIYIYLAVGAGLALCHVVHPWFSSFLTTEDHIRIVDGL